MPDANVSPDGDVAAVLTRRYGLACRQLTLLPIGQGTVNYRADCGDGAVFVKAYPWDADLKGERAAIGLSALASQHGIPVARVLPGRDGEVIEVFGGLALSAWEWMPGRVITGALTTGQQERAGTALGQIHAAFAGLPASAGPAPQVEQWRTARVDDLSVTISRLLIVIDRRMSDGEGSTFDAEAKRTLAERRGVIDQIPGLLAELPELTAQVLHGDYSPVNLLFDGDQLSAVLDFSPPDPFLLSYDLGRMAFNPSTVVGDPGWMTAAATLITAYRHANPGVPAADIRACARVALLQLLGSLYGVKQHYLGPGLFQGGLDEFWLLRHRAADILLAHLTDTDDLLAGLTTK
jgi:Ser/Thr protein kinase RdoA (MazF antagonist)